jgi:hypothetical protein
MDAYRLPTRGAIGFLWGLALLLAAVASVQAAPPGARLVSVTGTVEILNVPSGQWVAAASPAVVPPGAAVRTGPKSQVVLELNGARVTLYDTTLIRIPDAASPASTAVDPLRHPLLDAGRALFDVTPRKDRAPFSVRTPTVVAGVKGTVFEVSSTGTEQAVYVWDGLVEVTSLLDSTDIQLVPAGQFTMLDDLRLTPIAPIPYERVQPPDVEIHRRAVEAAAGKPAGGERLPEDLSVSPPLDSKLALATDALRDADRAVVQSALDQALDFQSVVSIGTVRTSTDSVTNTLASPTDTLNDTTSTVTDPVTSTLSSSTDPLSSTVTVDDSLSSTLEPVVDSLDSATSTLTDSLRTLGF